jgi:tRNA-specific 2-thiouridylase
VDEQGRTVGEHQGFAAFTVGQRRGLNLALGTPYYVRRIDPSTRTVHIAPESLLYARRIRVRQTNWVSIAAPRDAIPVTVKIRYQHPGAEAELTVRSDEDVEIEFAAPQRALTPGQSAVFYAAERVLGGGLIASASQ